MNENQDRRRVPLLLWPFWAIWRLVAFIIGLTGRLIAVILGFVLMLAGIVLSITIVGAIAGVPMFLIGVLLVLRGIF